MARKRGIPPPVIALIVISALIGGSWVLLQLAERPPDSSAPRSGPERSVPSAAGPARDPLETLRAMQAEKRIVNVHEHVQSLAEAEHLLRAMDAYGVGKTILLGSSWFTITLNEGVGFTRYDEINEELIKAVRKYPGRFEAWPTINPQDSDKLDRLETLHQRGATGLKLYIGHGFVKRSDGQYMFHTMALDDPSMLPIYAYCEANYIPICLHVQPNGELGPGIAEEFVAVLTAYPDMKVIAPHFILSSIRDSRLREFLDTFPNLYSDVSFGHDSFLIPGLQRISKNAAKFRKIFEDYPDRFMWGTDLVITDHEAKSEAWMGERFQAYLDMLTAKTYTAPFAPGEPLRGLELDGALLDRILYTNYEDFIAKRPSGTRITRALDWERIGVRPTGRKAGERLPPPPR